MTKELFRAKEYCFITFSSTQHALKAEKALLLHGENCLIIPTPREITTNCGLAIKIPCQRCQFIEKYLLEREVIIDGIFQADARGMRPFARAGN